jgi:hypothetical protein
MYAKGYLVAWPYYTQIHNDGTNASNTRAGLQAAINDARDFNKILYLPAGTYLIDDTLKAYTTMDDRKFDDAQPAQHPIAIVGSTKTATRPVIILLQPTSGAGFGTRKVMLEFRNFDVGSSFSDPNLLLNEKPNAGYFNMLRGVDLDCNAVGGANPKNQGCVALYFNQAQDSSIENVKITATNANTGIIGLPSRAWGLVNVEIVGGQLGIDTSPFNDPMVNAGTQGELANVGSTIVGVKLTNQTVSAIKHPGQALTIVGFEITAPTTGFPGSQVIVGTGAGSAAQAGVVNMIDGEITLTSSSSTAIDNTAGKTIYLRNVYVTGSNNLVKSGSLSTAQGNSTGSLPWSQLKEYSYCNPTSTGRDTNTLIDGSATNCSTVGATVQRSSLGSALAGSGVPTNLFSSHVWSGLPTVDDNDYYDFAAQHNLTFTNGAVAVQASLLQGAIDAHQKVFLRAGAYRLDNKITLRNNTVLFGADRRRTRIEVEGWIGSTGSSSPLVQTDPLDANAANATTYLGDLIIGVPASPSSMDFFTALNWGAGRNSMVHIGRPYQNPKGSVDAGTSHNLIAISGSGGGRWYFLGRGESAAMNNSGYRILKVDHSVDGGQEPLWIYGLNMEHPRSDFFAEFNSAQNVRIYGVKTEFFGEFCTPQPCTPTPTTNSTLINFNNSKNIAVYGHTSVRYAPTSGKSVVEFTGSSGNLASTHLLAASIIPQANNNTGTIGNTARENYGTNFPLAFPNGLALYKRGEISATEEGAMTHSDIGYALPPSWTQADIGATGLVGSGLYENGVFTIKASGADIFGTEDEFHYAYQDQGCVGDCQIVARVASQQNTSGFAKTGVMIRAGTSANARFVDVFITPGNGARMHYRDIAGNSVVNGTTTVVNPTAAPYWVRLTRTASTSTFKAEVSSNGTTWTTIATIVKPNFLASENYSIGLINCSNDDSILNTSTFDNITVTN